MSDIGLFPINNCIDLDVIDDDLAPDDGLETAVIISIFSDRRITDEDLPDLETNKRGWWADAVSAIPNDQIGSRLWLLEREKRTTETLRRSEEYIDEGLAWMLEDGVAESIEVSSSYDSFGQLISLVEILRPAQSVQRYQVLWEKQEVRRA
jgi:phage gp46-like protein